MQNFLFQKNKYKNEVTGSPAAIRNKLY